MVVLTLYSFKLTNYNLFAIISIKFYLLQSNLSNFQPDNKGIQKNGYGQSSRQTGRDERQVFTWRRSRESQGADVGNPSAKQLIPQVFMLLLWSSFYMHINKYLFTIMFFKTVSTRFTFDIIVLMHPFAMTFLFNCELLGIEASTTTQIFAIRRIIICYVGWIVIAFSEKPQKLNVFLTFVTTCLLSQTIPFLDLIHNSLVKAS